jgi:HK97 family phage portal protein
MTSTSLIKCMMVHLLLWGNSYVEIERSKKDNSIVGLWPRNPAKTRCVRLTQPTLIEGDKLEAGTMLFETTDGVRAGDLMEDQDSFVALGNRRTVLAEDMIHVNGLSFDGRVGQEVTWLARQTIGLSLAAEKYAAKFFGNGARPAGILTMPNKQDDDVIENLRRSWTEAHGGENVHKVAILEEGVKFEKIAATPNEGQLLETRQQQVRSICAIFGVPLHMVAGQEKGTGTGSKTEALGVEFYQYSLRPWTVKIEQEFNRKLFTGKAAAGQYFSEFAVHDLLYADAESRSKLYSCGRQWGFLSADDIRHMEKLNAIGGVAGTTYLQPINMTNAADPMQAVPPPEEPEPTIERSAAVRGLRRK